jgi:hypothetical protein
MGSGVPVLLMLVSTYVWVLRKHNFLDIGARGEQDFSGDGVFARDNFVYLD